MIPKIFKPALFIAALWVVVQPVFAQDTAEAFNISGFDSESYHKNMKVHDHKLNVNTKQLEFAMNKLSRRLDETFSDFDKNRSLGTLISNITSSVGDAVKNVNVSVDDDTDKDYAISSTSSPGKR